MECLGKHRIEGLTLKHMISTQTNSSSREHLVGSPVKALPAMPVSKPEVKRLIERLGTLGGEYEIGAEFLHRFNPAQSRHVESIARALETMKHEISESITDAMVASEIIETKRTSSVAWDDELEPIGQVLGYFKDWLKRERKLAVELASISKRYNRLSKTKPALLDAGNTYLRLSNDSKDRAEKLLEMQKRAEKSLRS